MRNASEDQQAEQTEQTEQIERLARACADEAIEAAGSAPYDVDGRCLLPAEPLPGDLEALVDELGRQATDAELAAFASAYAARVGEHIARRLDANTP